MTTATTAAAIPAPRPLSPPKLSHAAKARTEDVTQILRAGAVLEVLAMPAPDYR